MFPHYCAFQREHINPPCSSHTHPQAGWTPEDSAIFGQLLSADSCSSSEGDDDGDPGSSSGAGRLPPLLLVANKQDLAAPDASATGPSCTGNDVECSSSVEQLPPAVAAAVSCVVPTSAVTGQGVAALSAALLRLAGAPQLAAGAAGGGRAWAVNERQAEALTRAQQALRSTLASVEGDLPLDFWTIDLRAAVIALGEVDGTEVGEQVLDSIFSRFCIGK